MTLKKWVRKVFGKLAGVNKVQEQVDAAFYFLNRYLDITQAPKAEGPLRELQMCDYVLLQIFHKVCEKHHLTYWLDYGSLLGAIRHKGFIPWDDDLDVSMPREDFDRAKIILKEEFEKVGLEVHFRPGNMHSRIGCGYKHYQSGIWMDIFPVDFVSTADNSDAQKEKVRQRVLKYAAKYHKKFHKLDSETVTRKRREYIQGEGPCWMMVHGMEFKHMKWIVIEKEKVLPCKKVVFEEGEFYVPADYSAYLTAVFGKNYMGFPKSGLEHHGNEQGALSVWAAKNNVDMQEAYRELLRIYDAI